MQPNPSGRVAVGHPVDVASGTLFHNFKDYIQPGRIPLIFGRRYSTAMIHRTGGMLGPGWSSPFEMRLCRDLEGYRMLAEDGETEISFDENHGGGANRTGECLRNYRAYHELQADNDRRIIVTRWHPDKQQEIARYFFVQGQGTETWTLTSCENLMGHALDFGYDQHGLIATIVQRREGRGFRLVYNESGFVTTVLLTTKSRELPILHYLYGDNGFLEAMSDSLGLRCSYEYDEAGRMVRETNLGRMVYNFRYDSHGRCVETSGTSGFGRTILSYDDAAHITQVTDAVGATTEYRWNFRGQIESVRSSSGCTRTYSYDKYGRCIQNSSAAGTSKYGYDSMGNRERIIRPGGATTHFEFDQQHRVTRVTDSDGNTWERRFSDKERTVTVLNPTGGATVESYNENGDLLSLRLPSGKEHSFEWSDNGNLVATVDFMGGRTEYESDDFGWLLSETDPCGGKTRVNRDSLGRISQIQCADGAIQQFGYTAYGHPAYFVDAVGATTRWEYSKSGQLTEIIRPTGARIQFEHSALPGQVTAIVNEAGDKYVFIYDVDGNIVEEHTLSGTHKRYERDSEGRVIALQDGSRFIRFKYNSGGDLTEARFSDGSVTSFSYDLRGLLVGVDNGTCQVALERDAVGRITAERQGEREIRHEYDADGFRRLRRSPLGLITTFERDNGGRVSAIRTAGRTPVQFAYDACGRETSRAFAGGARVLRHLDVRGRCMRQRVVSSNKHAGSGIDREYRYDGANNFTGRKDSRTGVREYTYDKAKRVVEIRGPDEESELLTYDVADNITEYERRQKGSGRGIKRQGAYLSGNRLTSFGERRFFYDESGYLRRISADRLATELFWNGAGQLQRVECAGSEWSYKYDGLGRRVEKSGPNGSVEYMWDGDVVLHEIHTDPHGARHIVDWEFDPQCLAPVTCFLDGSQYLHVNETAGFPLALVTEESEVAWFAEMDIFGGLLWSAGSVDCPVRLQGQWFDVETGLHYNRFRYYDPFTGRYISPDPIGLLGGLNSYCYGPNTLGWIDPFGLTSACPVSFDDKQVAAKFKHAAAFGVIGNNSPATRAEFVKAMETHIADPNTQVIPGTYHQIPVTHYYNPTTNLDVFAYREGPKDGMFYSGWRLNPAQARYVTTTGNLGGG